ncbi:general odorant-binding protein 68-like [Pieris brassicae]|uniref:general odorant-binding protein 68-like n=1 Tax=Pieris brassicae TaxID=7116 RepID=UPI001E65F966|nr:general odorant-binding protein 68-like [Pieris brassicae]
MLGFSCFLIFLSTLQSVMPQGLSGLCGPPPVDKPFECCKMPHLFTNEERAECGFEEPTEGKRRGPPDCSKLICLMKKKDLMKDDKNVDLDAISDFLDKWTAENADFKDTVDKAKERCLKEDVSGPPEACLPDRIVTCMFFEAFNNCPKWEESEKCDKLKVHMEQCRARLT